MRLICDLESTGLPKKDAPASQQPDIVQISCGLYSPSWERMSFFTSLVKLDGRSIESEAESVHGFSSYQCERYGVNVQTALIVFKGMADQALEIVAHNVEFERLVIGAALSKLGADGLWLNRKRWSCTMERSRELCALPGKYGLKNPTLEEAMNALYPNLHWRSPHKADEDMWACAQVAETLEQKGLWPQPWATPKLPEKDWREK